VCVCRLRCPPCNAHAQSVVCGLPSCTICFSRYLHHFHKRKLFNTKCVFSFSLQLLSETFLILRRNEPDMKTVWWFSCKVPVILVIFYLNLNLLHRLQKKKYSDMKFHENPSRGSRVFPYGRTDRRGKKKDEGDSRSFAILRVHLHTNVGPVAQSV